MENTQHILTTAQLIASYAQQKDSPVVTLNLSIFPENVTCYFSAN